MTFHRDICIRVVFNLFAGPECSSNSDKLVTNDMQSDCSDIVHLLLYRKASLTTLIKSTIVFNNYLRCFKIY